MSLFGISRSSKAAGVPLDKIKKLQKSLQQGEKFGSTLMANSNGLTAQVDSQRLTVLKLHQELSSRKVKLVEAEVQTTLTGESFSSVEPNITEDRNESKKSDRGRQGRKQADMIPQGSRQQETEDSRTNLDVLHKGSRQQYLKEDDDDLLLSLLHNNQTVLMSQAKAIEGTVQLNSAWLQSLQEDVGCLLPSNSETSSSEPDKKLIEKCRVIEAEKSTLTTKCEHLGETNKNLQRDIAELKKKYDRLDKENSVLKGRLAEFNSPPWRQPAPPKMQKLQVISQLYCPRKTELTDNVVTELTSKLKLQMDLYSLDLNMFNCDSTTQIRGNLPVIVICLCASRLGTDVMNALQRVPVGPNIAVLVLHHKDVHALPSQTSDKILTGSEYKGIGAIIDMAFLSHKGIYTCDMNNRGLEDLTNFIKRYSNQ